MFLSETAAQWQPGSRYPLGMGLGTLILKGPVTPSKALEALSESHKSIYDSVTRQVLMSNASSIIVTSPLFTADVVIHDYPPCRR